MENYFYFMFLSSFLMSNINCYTENNVDTSKKSNNDYHKNEDAFWNNNKKIESYFQKFLGQYDRHFLDILVCMISCNNELDFKPVCGTDNVTYNNLDSLQCAAKCGIDVSVDYLSECKEQPEEKTKRLARQTNSDSEFNACIESCPVTTEYNPVCGTNNVSYTNPGSLGCAQRCGADVTLRTYGRCPTG